MERVRGGQITIKTMDLTMNSHGTTTMTTPHNKMDISTTNGLITMDIITPANMIDEMMRYLRITTTL